MVTVYSGSREGPSQKAHLICRWTYILGGLCHTLPLPPARVTAAAWRAQPHHAPCAVHVCRFPHGTFLTHWCLFLPWSRWQSWLPLGTLPTLFLSRASCPTHRDEFWDAEQSPGMFLHVLCC